MDKHTKEILFSSKDTIWETPWEFFVFLDGRFNFTLDPCASSHNAKCSTYFTEKDNGLEKDWEGHVSFVNPPYGRNLAKWVQKSYMEGCKNNTTVVLLIPARTDTKYWHEYCMKSDEIFFVKGRLKFGDSVNPAPFPSAVVVFRNHGGHLISHPPRISTIESF